MPLAELLLFEASLGPEAAAEEAFDVVVASRDAVSDGPLASPV